MLDEIRARIGAACTRVGRDPAGVTLVAITKGHGADEIRRQLLDRGHALFGENRIQEWRDKAPQLPEATWHFVGTLQRNKVRYCPPFALIHSLNSVRLADALERYGERHGHTFRTLIEVNVADEESKRGAAADEAERLLDRCGELEHVAVDGLMAMAPYSDDPERARPTFAGLRELRARLDLTELSMGMSGDFEVAIEEGATIVRIGSALFPRPKEAPPA
jgi:pyridoxal phosphate enzyme (YggS family)